MGSPPCRQARMFMRTAGVGLGVNSILVIPAGGGQFQLYNIKYMHVVPIY